MFYRMLVVLCCAVAFTSFGCDLSESEQMCAAPGSLCDVNEMESTEPCADGEADCRRVEVPHCNGPWVRYCRSGGGGFGGAVGDESSCDCASDELCVQSYDGTCQGGEPRCIPIPEGCTLEDVAADNGDIDCSESCSDAICGANSTCTQPITPCAEQAEVPELANSIGCYGI